MTGKLLRILFVEDAEDDMLLILEALRVEYRNIMFDRVDTAQDLHEALARVVWDVIICDHNLPDLDSKAALQICQQYQQDAPFIIASGQIRDELAISAMMLGAADTISKDRLSRLVPAVRRELQNKQAIHHLSDAQARINRIAYFDRLTGLANRESLEMRINAIMDGVDPPRNLALMTINISRFLHIQSTLGIEVSDRALQAFAERIKEAMGNACVTARLGGDRFAVLFPRNVDADEVLHRIQSMQAKSGQPVKVRGHELFLSCHVGISLYPRDGRNFHALIANAETAMRRARETGRCNHLFFDASMNSADEERLALEHGLHRALADEEFALHYQPQFDLRSGRMIGMEALLRWNSPQFGAISPKKFIPLLEETRLIIPVGEWVLRQACMQNRAWQEAGLTPLTVAVNLSAIQFQQHDLIPMVRRILDETGLAPCYLELEITENIALHQEETIIATLTALRDMGVKLAIDDFGTGYSSLSYLNRFPVHKLKIDRSFVQDISIAQPECTIAKAIISLAHSLRLGIIAEGVETEMQARILQENGCMEVQGYLFSRPLLPEQIADLLADMQSKVLPPADSLTQATPRSTMV